MPTPIGSCMLAPRRSASRRSVCVLLLLSHLTACHTYRPTQGPLEQQVGREPIREARLIFRNGTEVSLENVTVRSDSVIGFAEKGRDRRAFSFADVASIEQRQVSGLRTSGVVLATTTVALAALILAALVAAGPGLGAASPAPVAH
jgi:hypothetical protein